MKKIANLFLASVFVCAGFAGIKTQKNEKEVQICAKAYENVQCATVNTDLKVRAKASYLTDFETGTLIYAQNETEHLPIASMCKIMTLNLCFDAVDKGVITMDEEITVSEKASSMGGSQVFLEANAKYPVRELLKSIVVCSANDSCVAMAERIAGSEELFIVQMNEKAKELGANDTLFANCTGLPKEPQYSCAKDVSLMMRELLTHEEYFEFGKVWLDKFAHPKGRYTEITNTNKLVRFYDGCDGGKTGFTNQAGFCLACTAKRNNMRIISVVIGAENSANRFEDSRMMLDYAFANYTMQPIVSAGEVLQTPANVSGGKKGSVCVVPARSAYVFARRGEVSDTNVKTYVHKLRAPVAKGAKAGELVVYKDGVEIQRVPLVTTECVQRATFFDSMQEVARHFNARK